METIQELSEYVKQPNDHDEWPIFMFGLGVRSHFIIPKKELTEEKVIEMADKLKARLLFDYHVNIMKEDPEKFINAKLP